MEKGKFGLQINAENILKAVNQKVSNHPEYVLYDQFYVILFCYYFLNIVLCYKSKNSHIWNEML